MSHFVRALLALSVVFALVLFAAIGPSAAMARSLADEVTVTVEPATQSVILGDNIDIAVTVTNTGTQILSDLVIHIDVTDPAESTSVDPEDWTSTLSKPVGTLGPNESTTVTWTIQPISPGSFALYAVALAPGSDNVSASNILAIDVIDQRSLNPNGILPVAIGAPALVGGLLVTQLRLNGKTRSRKARGRRNAV